MEKYSRDKILQELKVDQSAQLLEFLVSKEVRKSRSAIKPLLKHKQILVNEKIVTQFDYQLNKGDKIMIMKVDQSRKEKKLPGMRIIYEDNYIIIINKDAGVLSVSTPKERIKTVNYIMNDYVKKQKKKDAQAFLLHRMDREGSGLMILAKDPQTQRAFQINWNLFVKDYTVTGLIEGELTPDKGTITSWLTENKNYQVFSSNFDNGGLEAVTNYETVGSNGRYSLVRFRQVTRRKNQIRAQMQQKQTPIVGDKKYGGSSSSLKRVAMHADYLLLKHPVTGETMEFKSPIAKAMAQFVKPNSQQTKDER